MEKDELFDYQLEDNKIPSISLSNRRAFLFQRRKLSRTIAFEKLSFTFKIYSGIVTREDLAKFNLYSPNTYKSQEFQRGIKTAQPNKRKLEVLIAQPKWEEESETNEDKILGISFDSHVNARFAPKNLPISPKLKSPYINHSTLFPRDAQNFITRRHSLSAPRKTKNQTDFQSKIYKTNKKHLDLSEPVKLRKKLYSITKLSN